VQLGDALSTSAFEVKPPPPFKPRATPPWTPRTRDFWTRRAPGQDDSGADAAAAERQREAAGAGQ